MDHLTLAQLLGNYGEFIGAIAVVFTLGYLAVQVKHSRQSLDASTRSAEENRLVMKISGESEWMRSWNDVLSEVYGSAEKIRLMSRGLSNDPQMTDEEYMAFSMQLILILNHHHLSLQMSKNGMRDQGAHQALENFILMVLTSEGGRFWWDRSGFVMDQYDHVNALLANEPNVPTYTEWEQLLFQREEMTPQS
jgi:hypothetical protein